ncbi:MAG: tRNA (5-methylaminomethyl-2-thiouridine)(34)-methyltransferase MnmD [Bacteroidetes bacterium]|nr:tRNA (5-methylaminomethyl-2-thiouridine)(34)-methyltransferase MnmD [Bacteroidota bacterium]
MMEIIPTRDGSYTLQSSRFEATYHSTHGAMTEARHVFVEAGLQYMGEKMRHDRVESETIQLIEVGSGTLMNAAVALDHAQKHGLKMNYTGLELEPPEHHLLLEYWKSHPAAHRPACWQDLMVMYPELSSEEPHYLGDQQIQIFRVDARQWEGPKNPAHLIFFDAFSPEAQPEMWDESFLARVVSWMRPGGCLVTYCVKGEVRRRLMALGCATEKLPGPPGKREMLRVHKPI